MNRKQICRQDTQLIKTKKLFLQINLKLLQNGFSVNELQQVLFKNHNTFNWLYFFITIFVIFISILYELDVFRITLKCFFGIRCIIPNNYFIWEATRPISDCQFCINVTNPIFLYNISRKQFHRHSYSSKPIVIRKGCVHWPALTVFNFKYFENLYNNIENSYTSVDEECQFLHFQSNFISLRDVFKMSEARVNHDLEQLSWYIGWGNCNRDILTDMHKYYPKPHFLPENYEMPFKEYIFMGYDIGATMHLDFISRLMWQAQLQGTKTWSLKPSPECESVCQSFSFTVEPGDAVLIDTRIWYHGTTINSGHFSLAIQSEYG